MYTVEYFINKFEAIPEELWCARGYKNGAQRCALGHCGEGVGHPLTTTEGNALTELFDCNVALINDGGHPRYRQSTPKQRILAALRDLENEE